MDTKESIRFLENDKLTISIIDQSGDEYYEKIKGVVNLHKRGEKLKAENKKLKKYKAITLSSKGEKWKQ